MAKYTYKCTACSLEFQKHASISTRVFNCIECGEEAKRLMPKLNNSNITEVVDKKSGVTRIPDQDDVLKERKEEFFWTVEVPRMVNSGVYGVDTMLENGWIELDDMGKIIIMDKPPHKR